MSDGTGELQIISGCAVCKFYELGQAFHFLESLVLYLQNGCFGLEAVQGPQP